MSWCECMSSYANARVVTGDKADAAHPALELSSTVSVTIEQFWSHITTSITTSISTFITTSITTSITTTHRHTKVAFPPRKGKLDAAEASTAVGLSEGDEGGVRGDEG